MKVSINLEDPDAQGSLSPEDQTKFRQYLNEAEGLCVKILEKESLFVIFMAISSALAIIKKSGICEDPLKEVSGYCDKVVNAVKEVK